jgi:subtilase family serine protease
VTGCCRAPVRTARLILTALAIAATFALTSSSALAQGTPPSGYAGPNGAPQGCPAGVAAGGFAPNQYLTAYGYSPLQQAGTLGQGERVALVEIDGFNLSDVKTFAKCFGLHVPEIHAYGVGIPRLLPPGGEATLDLELLIASAPYLSQIDVYETSPDATHVLEALAAPLTKTGFKPDVISASLGLCESDTVGAVGKPAIMAVEADLRAAAYEGISVLAASGDTGSAGCLGASGDTTTPLPQLGVIYPASSPWVTAVGGVNFDLSAQNQIVDQVVWNDADDDPGEAGGGGFSMLFSRPGYQDGLFSIDERAVPDVALLADISPGYDAYCTAQDDCNDRGWMTFGGTSAATPLLAGGFALVDQMLRHDELLGLGLANPLIYRFAQQPPGGTPVFYDVTAGSNDVGPYIQGDQQPLGCCTAAAGFDEASGWGGINLDQFALDTVAAQPPLATVRVKLPSHQRPDVADGVAANVSCSRGCDIGLRADVTIGRREPFAANSSLVHLGAKGSRTLTAGFSGAQLREVEAALKAHQRVTAEVTASVVDPAGQAERQSATVRLHITA